MKRFLCLFLACVMVLALAQPLSVWATAADTMYIDPANGADTNAGTEAAPVKTLAKAYSKLLTGGTIVFLSDLSLTGNTLFPVSSHHVTLTSKTGSEGIITTGTLRMQGDTTFKDITVTFNAASLAFISGEGYDLTIDTWWQPSALMPHFPPILPLLSNPAHGITFMPPMATALPVT